MNAAAVKWACAQRGIRPTDRHVLIALAHHANLKTDLSWPSVAALVEFTGLNRKQVIPSLDRLEAYGLIKDSGDRQGRTRQVKVYRLKMRGCRQRTFEEDPIGDC